MKKLVRTSANSRDLLSFYELSEEWQAEAISNHDTLEQAEEQMYIAPLSRTTPKKHFLLDLSDCMRCNDSDFDGIIGVSNNSAIGVKISDCQSVCWLTWL